MALGLLTSSVTTPRAENSELSREGGQSLLVLGSGKSHHNQKGIFIETKIKTKVSSNLLIKDVKICVTRLLVVIMNNTASLTPNIIQSDYR